MIINRTQTVNGNNVTTAVAEVPVTAKAVHKATLMKEDFIKLSFDSDIDYKFKAGDYITFGGMNYYLPDDYFPTMKDEGTFSYEMQFNAPWYNLDKVMFLFNTYNDDVIVKRESDWYITDTAQNILALIIRSTQDGDRDCQCRFNSILDCEPTVVKTFTFSSTSILSALNNLAKDFELEWWVTYEGGQYYLHFGECDNSVKRGDDGSVLFVDGVREKNASLRTELTAGVNVTKPSVSQRQGLKRLYYVFGSSRNIDQNAVQDMENGFVTSIVTKRLELAGNPQDMVEGSGEEVVIFDDIYPRSDYQITGVTPVEIVSEEVLYYEDDGTPVFKRYNVYNLKIKDFSDYVFSLIQNDEHVQNIEDVVASGKPLSLKFITKEVQGETITPLLAGFEFELGATLCTDPNTGEEWYEFQIIKQDINGYIIPNDNLIPNVGDWVCIYNVKGAYIGGLNSNNGQDELRNAFNKWYANKKKDVSYTIKPYANEDIDLNIGDAVVLNYKDNSVVSRVFSYEKAIDLLIAGLGCSDASYTISSYAKFGAVNQLKEDVKILTASIANGTAGGSVDASSLSNAVATYGRRLFLSKVSDDAADGHIDFNDGLTSKNDTSLQKGATFGTFQNGFLGSGAEIDRYGRAEVQSLYSREFISTPEFRFNRITVTEGEQWNTNGFGIIEKVVGDRIYLHLEKGDIPSVKEGDICRGLYSNIGLAEENGITDGSGYYNLGNQPDYDDCNFPTKAQFFTSYFWVSSRPAQDSEGNWYFKFQTKDANTPLPCKNMKFAQYGNFWDTERQASLYQTSLRHSYIQQLEGVNTWVIGSANVASRYGSLDGLTVLVKDSNGDTEERTLQGNGLYVQDNVYFGNATIQIDPVTIEDLKRQLANYSVHLTAYTDVIKVDDAGNVIDGLWTDSGEGNNISRQYRIYTALSVRNGITPLTIAEGDTPAGEGTYKVDVHPYGCSCKFENSTLFITGIDNVKDGVVGTDDDSWTTEQWEAMRSMERVWVDMYVNCEGLGTIIATVPITIKHDPVPYIMADLTNENAGISWDTAENEYVGLPIDTYVNMAKGNEDLSISKLRISTINGEYPLWNPYFSLTENAYVYNDTNPSSPTYGWNIRIAERYYEETERAPAMGDEFRPLAGLIRVVGVPQDAPSVSEIIISCSARYAGVSYERELSLHIMRSEDMAIWDVIPTHQSINVDRNAYFNFQYVGVQIYSTDRSGRSVVSSLPTGYHLGYRITRVLPTYTAVTNPSGNPTENGWYELSSEEYVLSSDTSVQSGKTYYSAAAPYSTSVGSYINLSNIADEVRVNDPNYADTIKSIEFTLFDSEDNILDSEEVPVIREGLGGQGSTGPAGNGVQQVTDYYMRAKSGYTPVYPNTLEATPSSSQVEVSVANPSGWVPNVFTAPSKEWPCVWHFTKYDYTQAADYDSRPHLLTKYAEDGRSIVDVHAYYLKTTIDNVHNIYRLDQTGGENLGWVQDVYSAPDSEEPIVWRYFAFEYSPYTSNSDRYSYSPIEFVAKFVEDGTSFQCAYKVFPSEFNGQPYTPSLDNVSTGANMPKTSNSSWSESTTGLVVSDGMALWMTQRTYKGTNYGEWGTPVRLSGFKGETGADGTDIEFIYKLSNDGNPSTAEKPTYDYDSEHGTYWSQTIDNILYKFDEDDFNPSNVPNATGSNLGWTDNPSGVGYHDVEGVETFFKYEWVCQRTKQKGSEHWGGWVGPFVWSAYGDTGMDGDGVEYVFTRQENASTPSSPVLVSTNGLTEYSEIWKGSVYKDNDVWLPKDWTPRSGYYFSHWDEGYYNTQGEWIPELHINQNVQNEGTITPTRTTEYWSDDPTGVNKNNPKEWVSTRKRVNGKWGNFSAPALWATYSETPNIRIVGGFWWLGDDYLRDEDGHPVKAEGEDGTGIQLKGRVDIFEELVGMTPVPHKGDCYVVSSTRHLWVYVGDETTGHNVVASDWQDMGEFQGAAGADSQLHFAWALERNVVRGQDGEITDIIDFTTRYEDLDPTLDYAWMGIATTNSVNNPNNLDPEDWEDYKWNHVKGRDGEFFERVFMTTDKYVAPVIDTSYTSIDFQVPEFHPNVANQLACGASSFQFYDDPIGDSLEQDGTPHFEHYPYEWMAERKKVDGVWQAFGRVSLWAKHGKDGEKGDSVDNVTTYYLKTTMSIGVNYNTEGWVQAYTAPIPDADKPYVWRYSVSYVGEEMVGRTACELIAVYSPVPNINLLEDTAFSSIVAMEAWEQQYDSNYKGISYVSKDPTANPYSDSYRSDLFNNFFGVTTGTQGHNAYMGRFKGTQASGSYVVLLRQYLLNSSVTKVEAGKWYTLSYWVKGNSASMFNVSLKGYKTENGGRADSDFVDKTTGMYINGTLITGIYSYQFKYSSNHYSGNWTQHIITFKTVANLEADTCFVEWTMYDRTTEHEIHICMPKLEVGMIATTYSDGSTSTKAWPRTGEWESGKQYYAGNIGERYFDAVFKGYNWYRCIKTHFSNAENSPTSENGGLYWKEASWAEFTATGLLLAQEAYIENLVAKLLRTGEPMKPHVEMHDDIVEFYGEKEFPSITLCTDDDGVGVLRFYDKDGNPLYDLGPNGITQQVSAEASHYINTYRKKIDNSTRVYNLLSIINNVINPLPYSEFTRFYKLVEGWKMVGNVKKYNIAYLINSSNADNPSTWNGREFTSQPSDNNMATSNAGTYDQFIPDGWYASPLWGPFEEMGLNGTLTYIEIHKFEHGVEDVENIIKAYFVASEVISQSFRAKCYDENGNNYTTIQELIDAQITI